MIKEATDLQTQQLMTEIQKTQLKSHKLTDATIELTKRCNFNCIHCYIENKEKEHDLDYDYALSLIDELEELGCLSLLFTGGEPILHPQFKEIWKYAYEKGLLLSLFTNGSLIDDNLIEFFTRFPPMSIDITIYGLKSKTFKSVTGTKDLSNIVINNAQKMVKKGLKLFLKTMVLKQNSKEIIDMFKFSSNLGVSFRFDPNITPTLKCNDRSNLFAGKKQLKEIIKQISLSPEKEREISETACKLTYSLHHGDRLFCCGAGRSSVFIDNIGNKHPCVMKRISDNTVKSDIPVCLREVFPKTLNIETDDIEILACVHCEDSFFCNWCPAIESYEFTDYKVKSLWKKNLCISARLFKEKYLKKPYKNKDKKKFIGYAGYFEKKDKEKRHTAENTEGK